MKPRTKQPIAVIYCRVSTLGQAQEGVGLQAQEAAARSWCQAQGLQVASVHVDEGLSGGTMDREGLQKAVDEACRRKASLVAYSLSRITRSVKDALALIERLEARGAGLVSLSERLDTSSASGRFTFTVLSSVGQLERELVGERTRAALQHLRSQGRRVSGVPPYGFKFSDGQVVEDPAEQETLRTLKAWRAAGMGYREIEARANEELPCRGKRWRYATIYKLLA